MQYELFDVGSSGELTSRNERRMAPSCLWATTDLPCIFFGGVHRVENEHVRALGETSQLGINDCVVLGIGDVHDRFAFVLDTVGVDAVGMVAPCVRYTHVLLFPNRDDFTFVKVTERHLRAHLGQMHGKARVVHLARERFFECARDVVTTEKMDDVLADKRRRKERKALDVVPMHMAKEKPRFDGHLGKQTLAQQPQSRAAIQNDQCVAGPNLIAARIAAILNRIGSGRGDASADTPSLVAS
jgi:hypothetical protein